VRIRFGCGLDSRIYGIYNPYTILARKRDEKRLLGRIVRRKDTNMESGLKAV
jgi:hypothetical protein